MSKLANQRIQDCIETRSLSLDLGGCNLYRWPEELFKLTWLEDLNLRNRKWNLTTNNWDNCTGPYNFLNHIPEKISNLKALKRLELGGSGKIYSYNRPRIQDILDDDWGISDISPLSNLVNLEILNLRYCQLNESVFSVISHLPNLKKINLSNNPIRSISQIGLLKKLESLELEDLQIKDFAPLESLKDLRIIRLRNNNIEDLNPFSGLDKLEEINLVSNKVTDLTPIIGLTNIKKLVLLSNNIRSLLSLAEFKNLQILEAGYNDISNIEPLTECINLQKLDLSFNSQINDFSPLISLKRLESLKLHANQINKPEFIGQLKSLQELDLSSCEIHDFSFISSLYKLRKLNLSACNIAQRVPRLELPKLEDLDLSNNQISDISPLGSLFSLKSLDLNSNTISDLTPLNNLSNISLLNLSYNPISDFWQLGYCERLEILNLSRTRITQIDFLDELPSLKKLFLSFNRIDEVPYLMENENLETLDLSFNPIISLKGLSRFQNLKVLNLFSTNVNDLFPIKNLQSLNELILEGTNINNIDSISQLSNILFLNLASTNVEDLEPLRNKTTLTSLILEKTKIDDLYSLTELYGLRSLNIANTTIHELAPISKLEKIRILELEETQINELSSISNLSYLQYINLRSTKINSLVPISGNKYLKHLILTNTEISDLNPLSSLKMLKKLDLRHTMVQDLRPLKNHILSNVPITLRDQENQEGINVSGCFPATPPIEIIANGNKAILNYFTELDHEESAFIYEAKLLIIGEGGVGKTTLARKLIDSNERMPAEEESTKGISIEPLSLKLENGQELTLHIWDFGGQEIYHATHQFFLTKRSLYILVDDTRKDDKTVNDASFKYWLQTVELFGGGNSPLLIVQNEKGGRSKQIDFRGMKGRFDFIKEQFRINLLDGIGLDKLKKSIKYHIQQLPHIGELVPRNWIKIRKELETISNRKPVLGDRDYYSLCEVHGISSRERANLLSAYLHDLGVFLHFREDPLLKRYVILENEWATDAAYRVLDDENIKSNFGYFERKDVRRLWEDSNYSHMHDELLALMRKFELCYELDDGRYLIPQLLPASEPENNTWNFKQIIQLRYRYGFMPKGLLSRLIIRLHRYVRHPEKAWRSGVLLDRNNTTAKIEEIYGKQEIIIKIGGDNCKEFMTLITEEISILHEGFESLKVERFIPCICSVCRNDPNPYFYRYESLRKRKLKGIKTIECDRSYNNIKVEALLDAVFVTNSQKADSRPLKIFISYSKADFEYLEKLKLAISPLRRQQNLISWDDKELMPGEQWNERIKSELNKADIILLLVSADSLATDFIHQFEVRKAMDRHYDGSAAVIPIILRPCMWEMSSFAKLSALPGKGKPISKFRSEDVAWLEVTKGIEKVAQRLKVRKS